MTIGVEYIIGPADKDEWHRVASSIIGSLVLPPRCQTKVPDPCQDSLKLYLYFIPVTVIASFMPVTCGPTSRHIIGTFWPWPRSQDTLNHLSPTSWPDPLSHRGVPQSIQCDSPGSSVGDVNQVNALICVISRFQDL